MPNGILVFILTTSLDKHLVTTSTYLVAQILDSNAEDKNPISFLLIVCFRYVYKTYTCLNKIVKSEILSDLSMFL